ncbi:hypothetical protein J6590_090590 [Homalodisca vitripennis]|nr:hypothetical protein J6590_090590 [Homalodisca vitripennis]
MVGRFDLIRILIVDSGFNIHLKRSETVGDEEAQNELSTSFPHQRRCKFGSRQTRDIHSLHLDAANLDVVEAEKRLVAEMGEHVCVYERVCAHYAQLAEHRKTENHELDWNNVFSKYAKSPDNMKQFYLLSVILGDVVASPSLCHQLAKRGRGCGVLGLEEETTKKAAAA